MILGSKERFIPHYLSGRKKHSFRQGDRWRAGMDIQFYRNVRTKDMAKFRPDSVCSRVQKVRMTLSYRHGFRIMLDGKFLFRHEWEQLAYDDGFDTPEEFINFFMSRGNKEWVGQLVHWS